MNEEILNEEKFLEYAADAEKEKRPLIAIFQDKDGNWRGVMKKDGRELYARQTGPETVLQLLLTHDGKPHTKTE